MDNFFNEIQNMDLDLLHHVTNNIVLEINNDSDDAGEPPADDSNNSSESNDEQTNIIYGCKHYLRRCSIVSPCCQKVCTCRLCHDELFNTLSLNSTEHKLNRFEIKEVVCSNCNKQQSVKQYCEDCNTCFGLYYCDICHLFDDIDKGQFHCNGCGFCRIGGKDNFIHCDKCDMCIVRNKFLNHKCINITESLCPICMMELYTSTMEILQVKCGHYMHKKCFNELLNESYKCPLCSCSIIDTENINKMMDDEVNSMQMPQDYENTFLNILCNDCHLESLVKFHIVGLKCSNCNGYNTRKI